VGGRTFKFVDSKLKIRQLVATG